MIRRVLITQSIRFGESTLRYAQKTSGSWTENSSHSSWIGLEHCFSWTMGPQEYRSALVARFLRTVGGRTRLAQAMIQPLRTTLHYESLGRKILKVEELPPSIKSV